MGLGAKTWTAQRRVIFAHDVATAELVAVEGRTNLAKSYRGPASWQPSDPRRRCGYAIAYITVKAKYRLSVTAADRAALREGLAACVG